MVTFINCSASAIDGTTPGFVVGPSLSGVTHLYVTGVIEIDEFERRLDSLLGL